MKNFTGMYILEHAVKPAGSGEIRGDESCIAGGEDACIPSEGDVSVSGKNVAEPLLAESLCHEGNPQGQHDTNKKEEYRYNIFDKLLHDTEDFSAGCPASWTPVAFIVYCTCQSASRHEVMRSTAREFNNEMQHPVFRLE